jgi:myo-inositol-1(or 4)-monophosphatase
VAAGRYAAYWELGIAPWDQAAGILIVREAGGRVTDPGGTDSIPATPMVVASNTLVHDELCAVIATAMPDHLR